MVHGLYTSTLDEQRMNTRFPMKPVSEREMLAVTQLILAKKLEAVRAKQEGHKAKDTAKRRRNITLEDVSVVACSNLKQ
eukprot:m.129025 g.129025  ORF g.129025 m.129025 type:complete len:79 (+) comp13883_c1_seq2:62-298(+)